VETIIKAALFSLDFKKMVLVAAVSNLASAAGWLAISRLLTDWQSVSSRRCSYKRAAELEFKGRE